ncbi:replicative helicase loader/inhibitor [Peribacillus asahii]|uniref:replicative helicase loader/inhibitor n=1 Tax=Peribacillus asahii TaxID=228899 RepID=UPI00207B03C0|nr:replicative helicase loader/inhibitor [Peribacillus asahii]USK85701.1 hypothetical protein LIT35_03275 [Peribacillus asahii]
MNATQVANLLDAIQASYPGKFKIENPANVLESWKQALKNHDFQKVSKNFERHLETSAFPPTIADLVKGKPLDRINAIPDVNETRKYLDSLDEGKNLTEAQLESIKKSKAEVRRILGLER